MVLIFSTSIAQAQQPVQFVNPIPIPYKMEGPNFSLDISAKMHNFDPNGGITGAANRFGESLTSANINVPLQAYCYNGTDSTGMTYLGPTLIVQKGDLLNFDIKNSLPGS
ncbi:MAG: hypothetical protein AB8G11_04885 [Saprospiraceae bacterium]